MFVVIDGVDASWKTTQLNLLKENLEKKWKTYDEYDFPQYDKESSFLVREYLQGKLWNFDEITAKQASLLYAVDRFYVKNDIRKSIQEKDFVLSNRYTTSNIVHQATKLEDEKEQEDIVNFIENIEYDILDLPKPDKVIFLDMYIDIAWELNKKRWWGQWRDIHELDYEYLKNSYFRAINLAKKKNWTIIKCYENDQPRSLEDIQKDILKELGLKRCGDKGRWWWTKW